MNYVNMFYKNENRISGSVPDRDYENTAILESIFEEGRNELPSDCQLPAIKKEIFFIYNFYSYNKDFPRRFPSVKILDKFLSRLIRLANSNVFSFSESDMIRKRFRISSSSIAPPAISFIAAR